jgi:asparagine synthase (glutamine-hydrolysing)
VGGGEELEFEGVAGAFPGRTDGLATSERRTTACRVRAWAAPGERPSGAHDPETGSWIESVGNPTRSAGAGEAGAILHACLASVGDAHDGLSPPFALVFADGRDGTVHVAVDRCGLQQLYLRRTGDGAVWIASSLLALAERLGPVTADRDAAAVWLAAGHHLSSRTLVHEIRKLEPGERLRLDAEGATTTAHWKPVLSHGAVDEDYRSAMLAAVRAGHDGDGTAFELTGGLDSRLLLAACLTAGLPARTWTLGSPESAELRTVRKLQRRAGFEHLAVTVPEDAAARLPELVSEMHALADGEVNALEYAPLLLAFEALEGRRTVSVSGSGGEIARGYYYGALRGGAIDVALMVKKLSSATGAVTATMRRDVFPDPLAPLRTEVEGILARSPAHGPEGRLDDFYVRARMQRFGGRNISTTGVFCRQALPYFENRVVEASLALPASRKQDGRVVRDALAVWTPSLARIPLDSGIAVSPRSWREPLTQLRWSVAMGRKALARYGGQAGRLLSAQPPDPVPWDSLRASPGFHEFVRSLLPPEGSRVHAVLEPAATTALVERSLAGGPMYPLGLVLTLELTLRRLAPGWA